MEGTTHLANKEKLRLMFTDQKEKCPDQSNEMKDEEWIDREPLDFLSVVARITSK